MALGLYIFCGIYSICIVLWSLWVGRLWHYEAFGLVAFVVFMGHWRWTFVASTGFVLFMECFGLELCGVHIVCSVSEAFSLVFLFLFIWLFFL